ncbi:MAG: hypothetical protein GX456_13535 [Verrucomicrobia bacterium]|nr:hypothetical protein [Verrucomicrobiota bacterium]
MRVGRRKAFGVRQLAAAFFLCANNVPGTLLASPLMHSARQGRRGPTSMQSFMHSRARCPQRAANNVSVPISRFGSTAISGHSALSCPAAEQKNNAAKPLAPLVCCPCCAPTVSCAK